MSVKVIQIASQFSRYPAGRYRDDGAYSGEVFREDHLRPALYQGGIVEVNLDGAMGYGSSFLEEAFGGLVRLKYFSASDLRARLRIISEEDPSLLEEIWGYIDEANS